MFNAFQLPAIQEVSALVLSRAVLSFRQFLPMDVVHDVGSPAKAACKSHCSAHNGLLLCMNIIVHERLHHCSVGSLILRHTAAGHLKPALLGCRIRIMSMTRYSSIVMITGPSSAESGCTCARAHSRTETIRSWSGWKTWPTLPMGWGSVTLVGKWPRQSRRPNSPRQPLCRSAVLGKHQGTSS